MTNIKLVDEAICTGCGACYNICPKKAITMQPNNEGFLYPVINEHDCIDCGLCLKSCAAYNPQYENSKEPECYAVWADDEIRMKSSSGGAFTLLANYVLDQGGYVCGAAWDKDFNVEHKLINRKEDLHDLQGVKYIQSSTKKTFIEIKRILQKGKLVLFVGTPCQVAGLKAFLQKKDYKNLILVDLVCHGVPSPGIWQKHLKEKTYGQKIKRIKFRNKKYGWNQCLEIELNNGIIYRGVPPIDIFYETFFVLMNTRKSCGKCAFANISRQGDLTIGDAWKCQASMNDNKGTSEILVNNEKGKNIYLQLIDSCLKSEKFDLDLAKMGNKALTQSFSSHKNRDRFLYLAQKHTLEKSYDYAKNEKYDVGLLGIFFYQNYGCVLTTFALGKILQSFNKEIFLIDNSKMFSQDCAWRVGCIQIKNFLGRYFDIKECANHNDLVNLNHFADGFVVGSDQLFNWFLTTQCGGYTYFLDFVDASKRKIAYATSFGDGYCFFKKEYLSCKPLLQDFDAISIREKNYLELVNDEFKIKADFVLDPVFLLDKQEYEKLSEQSSFHDAKGKILAYILDMTEEKKEIINYLKNKLKKEIVVIPDATSTVADQTREFNIDKTLENISIPDWLYYFKNADYVFTDSFHGLCFSIIFEKNFSIFINKKRSNSRFQSLLSLLTIENRAFDNLDDFTKSNHLQEDVDYISLNQILDKYKKYSREWLENALNKEKDLSYKITNLENKLNMLLKNIEQHQKQKQSKKKASFAHKLKKWLRG